MKRSLLKKRFFLKSLRRNALLAAMVAFSGEASAEFKVVGYFPTWQGDVNAIPYSKLTHINYSFVLPTNTGGIMPLDAGGARLQALVNRAHTAGVKVLIAVGGWNNGDDSAFRILAANSAYRNSFVNNIANFVNQYNLDGVDIDWEYPNAGAEANNYLLLMRQLSTRLHGQGKLLTAAVTADDFPGSVNAEVINAVDYLNLMAYDMGRPHSTYQQAENALTHWIYDEGLPPGKAILGVPFYSHTNWVAYKDIITRYGASAAQVDNAGGLDYNGQPTIRAKAELAKAQAGGIMFWELSQDTTNATSLLSTIAEVVGGGTGTVEKIAIPGTLEAEKYQDFQDSTSGNAGNVYRYDDVDIETSTQNGYNVGWIAAGEWLDYTINTARAGVYKVDALVASKSSGGKFHLSIDNATSDKQTIGQFTVPVTGGWQNWRWVSTQVTLPAGEKRLRITMDSRGFNLNALRFTQATSGGGGTPVSWKKANLTHYTSYPDPGSDECVNYNGCQWAGYFAFREGKQPESWVRNNNIIAVHSKDATQYQLKTLRLRQGSKSIDAIVYDMCSDSDCDGCCSENARETGFLIDVEKYTMQRFGSGDGIVEWTCLDCK